MRQQLGDKWLVLTMELNGRMPKGQIVPCIHYNVYNMYIVCRDFVVPNLYCSQLIICSIQLVDISGEMYSTCLKKYTVDQTMMNHMLSNRVAIFTDTEQSVHSTLRCNPPLPISAILYCKRDGFYFSPRKLSVYPV
jgi:hypothetical protein